jgi:two-component system, NarL family, response regulator YdfI
MLIWSDRESEFLTDKLLSSAIIVLVDERDRRWTELVRNSTVQGILPRDATESEIIASVDAVAKGLVVLHPEAIAYLLPMQDSRLPENPVQALSGPEIEVLEMLASGVGNKAIAKQLQISEHTVKFHVGSIMTKLNASSRTEAVIRATRLGLIML